MKAGHRKRANPAKSEIQSANEPMPDKADTI